MPLFGFFKNGADAGAGLYSTPSFEGRKRGVPVSVHSTLWPRVLGLGPASRRAVARCASAEGGTTGGLSSLGFFGGSGGTGGSGAEKNGVPVAGGGAVYGQSNAEPLVDAAAASDVASGSAKLTTPIPFEQFSREWLNISGQDTFDGFRLEGAKQVNKYLQTCHSYCLGTGARESGYFYQFGPTVALGGDVDPARPDALPANPHFFAMAKLGSDGTMQGRLVKTLCSSADLKLNVCSSLKEEQRNFYELCLDNTGRDWASSIKLAWQSCWIVDCMFSQVLTPKLQAGCEATYVGANGASIVSLGARFSPDKQNVVSCSVSQQPDFKTPTGLAKNTHAFKVQYVRKVTDRLSLAAECEFALPDTESALRVGWEYLFRQARVQGLVDSCGRISVFAQDMNGFGVSGLIDYWRGIYKFGFMMQVVPPPDQQQQQQPPHSIKA